MINRDFFVIPCYEMVKMKGRRNQQKLVEKTLYVRKNRAYVLLREVIGEKRNWKKIVGVIKAISRTPTIIVGK